MNTDEWCSAAHRKVEVGLGITWVICPDCHQPTPISINQYIRPHPIYAKILELAHARDNR